LVELVQNIQMPGVHASYYFFLVKNQSVDKSTSLRGKKQSGVQEV